MDSWNKTVGSGIVKMPQYIINNLVITFQQYSKHDFTFLPRTDNSGYVSFLNNKF